MAETDPWKRRFHLFMAARLLGVVTFGLGLAVAFTDIVRPGGSPSIGAILIVLGVIDAVVAPRLLTRHWKNEDRAAADHRGDR